MHENEISQIIVNSCFKIYTQLGPGLFESVYEEILYNELIQSSLSVERPKGIPVRRDNLVMEVGFRSDLIVKNKVILE